MTETTPSYDDVVTKLRGIVLQCAGEAGKGFGPEDIPVDKPFVNGDGPVVLDSVDAVEIAVLVKQAFGVEFRNASSASTAMRDIDTLARHVIEARAGATTI